MLNALKKETALLPVALNIIYASQTGNGERIAERLGQMATHAGLDAKIRSLDLIRPSAVRKLQYAVFVISTHGEGDPPDDAIDLFEFLQSERAPQLNGLKFRVLALGDRSYNQFCEAGRKLEKLLHKCGAVAFADRVDCDLDYDEAAARWSSEVVEYGKTELAPSGGVAMPVNGSASADVQLSVVPNTVQWSRKRPFPAIVERVLKITGQESDKDVHHLELSLAGSGLRYEPGDSLGVWAFNDPELVSGLLDGLAIDPAEAVELNGARRTIREWLTRHLEITRLAAETVKMFAAHSSNKVLEKQLRMMNDEQLGDFIRERQLMDLVTEYPTSMEAADLAGLLRPLTPRSYSIASSRASVDDEVHLTVATMHSNAIGRQRNGLASDYLNHRLQVGDEVGVYLEPNRRFRLPKDRAAPIILIAAGTGIAPYRAFLQQLEEEDQSPDCWLIFGIPHLRTDFLYQREWLHWRTSGLLNRIDCAFSRDQGEKRYVQHVVRDNSREIEEWLEQGASIYICGALAMGREVELALQQGVAEQNNLDEIQALDFLSRLRRERRLHKDLY